MANQTLKTYLGSITKVTNTNYHFSNKVRFRAALVNSLSKPSDSGQHWKSFVTQGEGNPFGTRVFSIWDYPFLLLSMGRSLIMNWIDGLEDQVKIALSEDKEAPSMPLPTKSSPVAKFLKAAVAIIFLPFEFTAFLIAKAGDAISTFFSKLISSNKPSAPVTSEEKKPLIPPQKTVSHALDHKHSNAPEIQKEKEPLSETHSSTSEIAHKLVDDKDKDKTASALNILIAEHSPLDKEKDAINVLLTNLENSLDTEKEKTYLNEIARKRLNNDKNQIENLLDDAKNYPDLYNRAQQIKKSIEELLKKPELPIQTHHVRGRRFNP